MTATATATAVPVRDREPAGLRVRRMSGQVGWGVLAWVVGIAFFLPVLWMVLTAFKPESAAQTWPPKFVFSPTLAQFRLVFSGWGPYVTHSLIATTVSTVLAPQAVRPQWAGIAHAGGEPKFVESDPVAI